MKKELITICFILFWFSGYSQNVSESLMNLRKKYSPLFSKESSILSIDYVRQYSLNKPDTTRALIIKVNKTGIEEQGVSVGTSIFGSNSFFGSTLSSSTSYNIKKNDGEIVMNKEKFEEFYDCANSVYRFISQRKRFAKEKLNTVAFCNVDNVSIGAELDPGKINDLKFYFKIGQGATFLMNNKEFEEIMGLVTQMKNDWE